MPLWFLWSLLALISWGIWALMSKLIGDALSAAQSQALSTIGLLPILAMLAGRERSSLMRFLKNRGGSVGGHPFSPHPGPLPRGEGASIDTIRPSERSALINAQDASSPLPEGEGQGEVEGGTKTLVVSSSAALKAKRGLAFAVSAGVLSCLGNVAYYHALNVGGKAATVIPLTALYPLVTIVLALLLLGERLNRTQIAGVILSLAAIYLFNVQREGGFLSTWLAFALIPIALWGVAGLLQKLATNHLSGEVSTVWFLSAFVPVAFLILLTQPWPASIAPKTWLLAAALGLFFGLGNYALLAAFARDGKASIITPLTALYPVVSVPVAVFFLGEKVGAREWAGISLALASVVALSYEKPNNAVK
ncbi:MAG: DMT family transporter [Verrucomicrobia bacterium]|nr:DMT family transporter [Verrucomicrobiota bacterium]